jgi:hypothetical protein
MKYWIFQNNQVLGPYEPDEMGKVAVFTPESLVCPEGRRGTSMGDWQRAGMVPDLSVALVRASSNGGGTSVLSIAGLPPEPTLKDLAQLGSIQDKVSALETIVLQLQEGLRAKDSELAALQKEAAGKGREADELKRQIAGLEERLSSVKQLSSTLDKAVEEEKRVEHDVEQQGRTLSDLTRAVEALRQRFDAPKPLQETPAVAMPSHAPLSNPEPPAFPPSPVMHSFENLSTAAQTPLEPAAFVAPAPIAQTQPDTSPSAAPKGKKKILIGAALGLAALAVGAVVGGLFSEPQKPQAPETVLEPAPLPPPEPASAPPPIAAPDPRELAVEFAKAWSLSGRRTLENALEKLAPPTGNLSPWMADPLAGSRVQVNYFARSSAPGAPTIAYEFEVDLDARTLVGRNAAAKSVLTGKAATPPSPPKRKPVRVKPKAPAAIKLPGENSSDSTLGAPVRRAQPKNENAPAQNPANDEALLDDLLKE